MLRKIPFIKPMAPALAKTPPAGADWIHEVKFDGWRAQIHVEGGSATIYSKNGADYTKRFRALRSRAFRPSRRSSIASSSPVTRPVCRAFVRSWNSETRRRGFASGASISFRSTAPGSRRCRFRCPTGMRRINRAAWIIRGKSELGQELPSFKDSKLSADIDLPPRNFGHQASPSRTPSALSRPAPAV